MFVSQQRGALSLIRQDVHMAQTVDLVGRWTLDAFDAPDARTAVATAMSIHDNGWIAVDDALPVDPETRRPLNFTSIDLAEHIRLYRSAYDEAVARDPETGLLVGMHWAGLYTMRYGLEPDGPYETSGPDEDRLRDATVAELEAAWAPLTRALWQPVEPRSILEDRVWRQYELFQFIDRLSIIMATRDLNEGGAWSVGRVRLDGDEWVEPLVTARGDGRVAIDPFPFEEEFTTALRRAWIPDREYRSDADLHDAMAAADVDDVVVRISAR